MPDDRDWLLGLVLLAEREGGLTYRLADRIMPGKGFAVSVQGPERKLHRPLLASDLEDFLAEHAQTIEAGNIVFNGGVCLGLWNAGTVRDPCWYLDLSIVVRSLDEALVIGRNNSQLAVYDLEGQQSVNIPYHAPPVEVVAM